MVALQVCVNGRVVRTCGIADPSIVTLMVNADCAGVGGSGLTLFTNASAIDFAEQFTYWEPLTFSPGDELTIRYVDARPEDITPPTPTRGDGPI